DPQPVAGSGSAASGLTLAELQEIGSEAGLLPEAVAKAAASLNRPATSGLAGVERLPLLRLPVGLNRAVPLGRSVDDAEWGWLVMHLREMFRARGQTETSGGFREWWNGNLRVSLEPSEEGDVLRMSTRKGGIQEGNIVGIAFLAMAVFVTVIVALKGQLITHPEKVAVGAMIALGGLGTIGANVLRLPGWANRRKAQFEALARTMLSRGEGKTDGVDDPPPQLAQGDPSP
ncbi:MAG: hypothetical protein HKO53_01715, partial [Gemmatimonadetes bacterium]|nr:hypothetical protein [Gemmatimonadota bacterium]